MLFSSEIAGRAVVIGRQALLRAGLATDERPHGQKTTAPRSASGFWSLSKAPTLQRPLYGIYSGITLPRCQNFCASEHTRQTHCR